MVGRVYVNGQYPGTIKVNGRQVNRMLKDGRQVYRFPARTSDVYPHQSQLPPNTVWNDADGYYQKNGHRISEISDFKETHYVETAVKYVGSYNSRTGLMHSRVSDGGIKIKIVELSVTDRTETIGKHSVANRDVDIFIRIPMNGVSPGSIKHYGGSRDDNNSATRYAWEKDRTAIVRKRTNSEGKIYIYVAYYTDVEVRLVNIKQQTQTHRLEHTSQDGNNTVSENDFANENTIKLELKTPGDNSYQNLGVPGRIVLGSL